MALKCPACDEWRATARGLFFHLLIDCVADGDREEAYALVAESIETNETDKLRKEHIDE